MTFARQTLLAASLLVCADAGAPKGDDSPRIVPEEAAAAIDQTPCPEVAEISIEECLLWLTPDAPRPSDALPNGSHAGAAIGGVGGGEPEAADMDPAPGF